MPPLLRALDRLNDIRRELCVPLGEFLPEQGDGLFIRVALDRDVRIAAYAYPAAAHRLHLTRGQHAFIRSNNRRTFARADAGMESRCVK